MKRNRLRKINKLSRRRRNMRMRKKEKEEEENGKKRE